jgi:hypothetical protein
MHVRAAGRFSVGVIPITDDEAAAGLNTKPLRGQQIPFRRGLEPLRSA